MSELTITTELAERIIAALDKAVGTEMFAQSHYVSRPGDSDKSDADIAELEELATRLKAAMADAAKAQSR